MSEAMSVDCRARLDSEEGPLHAITIREWVAQLPDGAIIEAVQRDFGSQRDPDLRLVGLRASWSEQRGNI